MQRSLSQVTFSWHCTIILLKQFLHSVHFVVPRSCHVPTKLFHFVSCLFQLLPEKDMLHFCLWRTIPLVLKNFGTKFLYFDVGNMWTFKQNNVALNCNSSCHSFVNLAVISLTSFVGSQANATTEKSRRCRGKIVARASTVVHSFLRHRKCFRFRLAFHWNWLITIKAAATLYMVGTTEVRNWLALRQPA